MTRPDEGLVYFIQCIETENYQSLTTDKIWHAKSDLTYILKDIVGARGDNVRSLRAAFKAAEERDWRKLDFVKSDALIDYETLMAEYRKGHKSTIETVQSRSFTGVHDLKDLPSKLSSISHATQHLQKLKEEEMLELRQQRQEEMLREQLRLQQLQQLQQEAQQHVPTPQPVRREPSPKPSDGRSIKSLRDDADRETVRSRMSRMPTRERTLDERSLYEDKMRHAQNLAERFTMLFEQEWKVALEYLDEAKYDYKEDNIKILADIVEACFQYSKKLADDQFQEMWEKTLFPIKDVPDWLIVPKTSQKETSKCLKKYRQDTAMLTIPTVQMMFSRTHLKRILDSDLHSDDVMNYTNRCIELSWLFNILSPPLCFLWARQGQKITGHLTVYSREGDVVGFNVWPALLLHKGGAVLCKGIVQPQ